MLRMRREQIIRLGRLLNMYYRPSELASEIGCHVDTIYRSYLPAGCPHKRDEHGHIWIIGTEFAEWARIAIKHDRIPLGKGEAYCLKCRKPVSIVGDIKITPTNRYLELVSGKCPECGKTVNRAQARSGASKHKAD